MQVTLLLVLHASFFLAGSVVKAIDGPSQSYPTGLRDDEDFSSPAGSGSGDAPVEPPMQSSGIEPPVEPVTVPTDRLGNKQESPSITPQWRYTTPSTTSSTTATTPRRTTTTTTRTTTRSTTTTAPYVFFTGVQHEQSTTTTISLATQLDESCLTISYIPTYPWPVKIFCNRESNTLRAVCILGQGQACYCVDSTAGNILYDVVYPYCGGTVTQPPQRTPPPTPAPQTPPPAPVTSRTRPPPKLTTTRPPATPPRPQTTTTARSVSTTARPTTSTTSIQSFKIDQETLDARAETTRSWDQGVPVIATFMGQPGLLAAIICGAVVGLLTAVLLVMFLVYRMRKKDEGSYVIEEPSKRVPLVQPYERTREYYA